ncbi:hypothetical protein C0J52_11052 [Blattella germanica]|nr:hypothetical protein C0J52_11052 [Blattella germanica]
MPNFVTCEPVQLNCLLHNSSFSLLSLVRTALESKTFVNSLNNTNLIIKIEYSCHISTYWVFLLWLVFFQRFL